MKIQLTWIGKTKENYLQTGIEQYVKRVKRYNKFEVNLIPDIKKGSKMEIEQLKRAEGALILAKVGTGDCLILLDEQGKTFASEDFAAYLQKKLMDSSKSLHFVVGGAYGFSAEVYERANAKLALSAMTFSHQMIRLIFTEQLYRAFSILNNEPYHHS